MKRTFGDFEIEVVKGDISDQPDVGAVVNAANAGLMPGAGVAGAIHRAAGPSLAEECRPLAPISPGEAVITGGHDLPNERVVHVLGPVYGRDEPSEELLASCYRNALRLADEAGVASIAFPAVSTGVFGYPVEDAARIALRTVAGESSKLSTLAKARFVLFSDSELKTHERALEDVR